MEKEADFRFYVNIRDFVESLRSGETFEVAFEIEILKDFRTYKSIATAIAEICFKVDPYKSNLVYFRVKTHLDKKWKKVGGIDIDVPFGFSFCLNMNFSEIINSAIEFDEERIKRGIVRDN